MPKGINLIASIVFVWNHFTLTYCLMKEKHFMWRHSRNHAHKKNTEDQEGMRGREQARLTVVMVHVLKNL
jgi:hypothetical protein